MSVAAPAVNPTIATVAFNNRLTSNVPTLYRGSGMNSSINYMEITGTNLGGSSAQVNLSAANLNFAAVAVDQRNSSATFLRVTFTTTGTVLGTTNITVGVSNGSGNASASIQATVPMPIS